MFLAYYRLQIHPVWDDNDLFLPFHFDATSMFAVFACDFALIIEVLGQMVFSCVQHILEGFDSRTQLEAMYTKPSKAFDLIIILPLNVCIIFEDPSRFYLKKSDY